MIGFQLKKDEKKWNYPSLELSMWTTQPRLWFMVQSTARRLPLLVEPRKTLAWVYDQGSMYHTQTSWKSNKNIHCKTWSTKPWLRIVDPVHGTRWLNSSWNYERPFVNCEIDYNSSCQLMKKVQRLCFWTWKPQTCFYGSYIN